MKPKLHPKSGSALLQTSSLLIPTLFICQTLATFSRVEFKRTVSKFTKRVDKKKKENRFLVVTSSTKCEIRKFHVAVVRRRERNAPVQLFLCKSKPMGCFHSRGQHLCKFIATKGSVCIRKEFNTHRIGLGHQHGRPFIALGHQNGKQSIAFFAVLVGVAVGSSRRASLGGGGRGRWRDELKADQKIAFGAEPFCKNTLERFFQAVQNKHISSDMCSPTWGNTYP